MSAHHELILTQDRFSFPYDEGALTSLCLMSDDPSPRPDVPARKPGRFGETSRPFRQRVGAGARRVLVTALDRLLAHLRPRVAVPPVCSGPPRLACGLV